MDLRDEASAGEGGSLWRWKKPLERNPVLLKSKSCIWHFLNSPWKLPVCTHFFFLQKPQPVKRKKLPTLLKLCGSMFPPFLFGAGGSKWGNKNPSDMAQPAKIIPLIQDACELTLEYENHLQSPLKTETPGIEFQSFPIRKLMFCHVISPVCKTAKKESFLRVEGPPSTPRKVIGLSWKVKDRKPNPSFFWWEEGVSYATYWGLCRARKSDFESFKLKHSALTYILDATQKRDAYMYTDPGFLPEGWHRINS